MLLRRETRCTGIHLGGRNTHSRPSAFARPDATRRRVRGIIVIGHSITVVVDPVADGIGRHGGRTGDTGVLRNTFGAAQAPFTGASRKAADRHAIPEILIELAIAVVVDSVAGHVKPTAWRSVFVQLAIAVVVQTIAGRIEPAAWRGVFVQLAVAVVVDSVARGVVGSHRRTARHLHGYRLSTFHPDAVLGRRRQTDPIVPWLRERVGYGLAASVGPVPETPVVGHDVGAGCARGVEHHGGSSRVD